MGVASPHKVEHENCELQLSLEGVPWLEDLVGRSEDLGQVGKDLCIEHNGYGVQDYSANHRNKIREKIRQEIRPSPLSVTCGGRAGELFRGRVDGGQVGVGAGGRRTEVGRLGGGSVGSGGGRVVRRQSGGQARGGHGRYVRGPTGDPVSIGFRRSWAGSVASGVDRVTR